MADFHFPMVDQSARPIRFMVDHGWRLLVLGTPNLAEPDRKPVHQAAREGAQSKCLPPLFALRQLEFRVAIEMVEIAADDGRFLGCDGRGMPGRRQGAIST